MHFLVDGRLRRAVLCQAIKCLNCSHCFVVSQRHQIAFFFLVQSAQHRVVQLLLFRILRAPHAQFCTILEMLHKQLYVENIVYMVCSFFLSTYWESFSVGCLVLLIQSEIDQIVIMIIKMIQLNYHCQALYVECNFYMLYINIQNVCNHHAQKCQKLIYLHLFTDLFPEDLSSILGTKTVSFVFVPMIEETSSWNNSVNKYR